VIVKCLIIPPPGETNQRRSYMVKVIVRNENGAELVLFAEQHPRLWEAIQSAAGEIIGEIHPASNGSDRKRGRPPKIQPVTSETAPTVPGENDNPKM
jgi:hypothetical protein